MDEIFIQEIDINEHNITEVHLPEENTKIKKKQTHSDYDSYIAEIISTGNGFIDIDFMGFGIRIKTNKTLSSNTVVIEYKGDIGKPNFKYKLI